MPSGANQGMRRVFVALAPPLETAAALLEAARAALEATPTWRLPAAAHVHLTLAFLGDTPEKGLGDLDQAVAAAVAGRPAPRLRIRGTGAFPDWPRPRVLWAGLEEPPESEGRLGALQADVAEALRRARFRFDDKGVFVPHLTLARPARSRRNPQDTASVPAAFRSLALDLVWVPDAVVCVESRLGAPAARRYPVLSRYPLDAS